MSLGVIESIERYKLVDTIKVWVFGSTEEIPTIISEPCSGKSHPSFRTFHRYSISSIVMDRLPFFGIAIPNPYQILISESTSNTTEIKLIFGIASQPLSCQELESMEP